MLPQPDELEDVDRIAHSLHEHGAAVAQLDVARDELCRRVADADGMRGGGLLHPLREPDGVP